jgi:acyl CoA:acetate/3-ketoacid CoA transferase alpha subunit
MLSQHCAGRHRFRRVEAHPAGDLYAAGAAAAMRLVGMPTATIPDQREPTDAEKQQFERHSHVGQK